MRHGSLRRLLVGVSLLTCGCGTAAPPPTSRASSSIVERAKVDFGADGAQGTVKVLARCADASPVPLLVDAMLWSDLCVHGDLCLAGTHELDFVLRVVQGFTSESLVIDDREPGRLLLRKRRVLAEGDLPKTLDDRVLLDGPPGDLMAQLEQIAFSTDFPIFLAPGLIDAVAATPAVELRGRMALREALVRAGRKLPPGAALSWEANMVTVRSVR